MHQVVVVATPTQRSHRNSMAECAAGHRSHIGSAASVAVRFLTAAVLLSTGVRLCTSVAMIPVAWTLVSVAAGIVVSTFLHHASHAGGVCVDCEDGLPA